MKRRRFQNRVVESIFTLPVCAVFAAVMWWWPKGSFSIDYLLGLLLCALTAYVILEINNVNALVRIRTRMVSCLWLLLAAGCGFLHTASAPLFATGCLVVSYSQLCRTYQRTDITIQAFHAYLLLALGSLVFPSMLLISVLYGIYLFAYMRSLNLRAMLSALMGLFVPYWLWMGWCLWQQDFSPLLTHLSDVVDFRIPVLADYTSQPLSVLSAWGLTSLLALVSIIHYLRNRYDDKIRVRMLLYIFVCQAMFLELAIFLQPQFLPFLLPMFMVSACPLIAHYFALTGSWISNAFFILSILLFAAVAVINLWMPL